MSLPMPASLTPSELMDLGAPLMAGGRVWGKLPLGPSSKEEHIAKGSLWGHKRVPNPGGEISFGHEEEGSSVL